MVLVPAGLDGNPSPITTAVRDRVVDHVADRVRSHTSDRVVVGVDGRSGSGKSTFADELASRLRDHGSTVLRSTTDSFHHPRAVRMRRGPTSAEGYYHDSHQVDVIVDQLVRPFAEGRPSVLTAAFDEPTDTALHETADLPDAAVLVFDGLFLHRRSLHGLFHVTVLLEADDRLDRGWLDLLLTDLPLDASRRASELDHRLHRARWPRYRDGWALYTDDVRPEALATVVIDNNDLTRPTLLASR